MRFLKRGIWAGRMIRMQGIEKIQKVCLCPAWVKHTPLVGKEASQAAERWRYQVETKSHQVNELQKAWLENKEKKSREEEN